MSVDQRLITQDSLRYLDRSNFQNEIDYSGLAHRQHHALFVNGPKTGTLGVYVVGSNSHLRKKEGAVIATRGCTANISLCVLGRYRDFRNDSSGGVMN